MTEKKVINRVFIYFELTEEKATTFYRLVIFFFTSVDILMDVILKPSSSEGVHL